MSQKAISGLSDRQARRLEEGKTVPHLASLKKLAEAHGMEANAYLEELAKVSARRSRPSLTSMRQSAGQLKEALPRNP
jgi:transcriptional regulator with XRE-family HTH domain